MKIADSKVAMSAQFSTNESRELKTATASVTGTANGASAVLSQTSLSVSISKGGAAMYESEMGGKAGKNSAEKNGQAGQNGAGKNGEATWDSELRRSNSKAGNSRGRRGNGGVVQFRSLGDAMAKLNQGVDIGSIATGQAQQPKQVTVSSMAATDRFRMLDDMKMDMLRQLVFMLTGKRLKFFTPKMFSGTQNAEPKISGVENGGSGASQAVSGVQQNTRTVLTETSDEYKREDKMNFALSAQVTTADGKQIEVGINLSMSKSFAAQNFTQSVTEEKLCDPLVFNFDGLGVQLTDKTFNFDIDNDGVEDQVSQLASGNGFLALDLNGDGSINNGGELFGTNSGNGFTDLSAYDSDGNGWIDAGDEVYDKLRIFTVGEDGSQQLTALGEKGIGAIYLGSVRSDFDLRNDQNELQAQVSHTGFYLNEDYTAGVVQNVNFNLYNDTVAHNKAAQEELITPRLLDLAL